MRSERSAEKPNGGVWEFSPKNSLVSPDYIQEIKKPFPAHLAMATSISENLLKEAEKWKLKGVYQGSSSIHGDYDSSLDPDVLFFTFEDNLRTKVIKNGSSNAASILKDHNAERLADYGFFPFCTLTDYDFINKDLLNTDRRVILMRSFFNTIVQDKKGFFRGKGHDSLTQTGVVIFEVFTSRTSSLLEELRKERERKTQESLTKEQQFRATIAENPSSLFEPKHPKA